MLFSCFPPHLTVRYQTRFGRILLICYQTVYEAKVNSDGGRWFCSAIMETIRRRLVRSKWTKKNLLFIIGLGSDAQSWYLPYWVVQFFSPNVLVINFVSTQKSSRKSLLGSRVMCWRNNRSNVAQWWNIAASGSERLGEINSGSCPSVHALLEVIIVNPYRVL